MADLRTNYLGLHLKNPLLAGASPISREVTLAKRLEDAGVGALVMYSLFEEEITHETLRLNYFLERGTESQPEAQTYLPEPQQILTSADHYLENLRQLKEALEIPVIASLNGSTQGGWISLAQNLQAAGADALELNIYALPTDSALSSEQIEKNYVALIHDVCSSVHIPVAVKLSPYFTALPHFLERVKKAGASGLVLFNRFMQPDIDIQTLEVNTRARLSTTADLFQPLRWIALSSPHIKMDYALSGGVHSGQEMVKGIMVGSTVVQMVSKLLKNGLASASLVLQEFENWMDQNGYASVDQLRGVMAENRVEDSAAFERANYIKALRGYEEKIQ
jgi:dihydroorotate dehydrogenase (fumarate)